MKKQIAAPFIIRTAIILLVLAIGVMIFLALLPQLVSFNISPGPEQCYSGPVPYCSTPYIAIKNTSLFPVTLRGWEIGYGPADNYVLPTRTLFPGETVRVWRGFGQNDANNLYAGRGESEWVLKGVYVHGEVPHIEKIYWGIL